ncbi:dTDP-4-amino-4,6-dideoxygalactose transaminase [Sporomusa malonica]|uniref:dTDP-4-amino-4,6-dideoxygalactose transaminase n=1 Tax=Sporomusa malonica TaxID=112901 RepID=A0A1W2EV02_9FIRM|nr:dTDP-4-amino-4,6-dideoxygalactose transaminase [Sporomusa malonica]
MNIYLKVSNATVFCNGHLALEIAIKALGLTGEVITTPFTFASTTHALINCGLTPVFCDIDIDTCTMSISKIENLITKNTSALLPVHVFGYPCNVYAIEKIAKKHGLSVIYDAAHVFGVEVDGKGIGTFGDVSMFSMHATKVFHSIEGGILTYENEVFKKEFNLLRNFGITGPEMVAITGTNAKMNEFQAAMGLVNLHYVDEEISKRQKIAYMYRKCLKTIHGIKFLEDMPNIRHNYAYFPIIIQENDYGLTRDSLYEKLQSYNVFTRKYFYPLTVDFDCYKSKFQCNIPNSRYIADRVLTLPMYGELELDSVEKICQIIQDIYLNIVS